MKAASFLLAVCSAASSSAWIPTTTTSSRGDVSLMMGSRSTQKKLSRQTWYEQRQGGGGGGDSDDSEGSACTIIGAGRIGNMLSKGEGESLVLKRGDSIPEDGSGPIFIATRNDSLDGIVENCPENRRKDLVFLQNGYLDSFLTSKDLMDNTQVLLFVSVTAMDAEPIDGITSVNPEGLTTATGEHAEAFAALLDGLGMKCNVVSAEDYRPAMFEKLIWISTYMLVGTAKECSSVGQAQSEHTELVEQVVNELVSAVSAKEGITFKDGVMERLAAYTDVVTTFPAAVKEFEWRNQYFYDLGDEACPTHNALLRECKEKELIGFDLP